jgi:succinoglycan biosynthesis transport protein ExoP
MLLSFKDSDPGMAPLPTQARRAPEFDLSLVLVAVRRRKLVMLASVVAALVLGMLYLVTTPRTYMALTQVMIGDEVAGISSGFNRDATQAQNEVMLESMLRVLQSQSLALAVVDDLDLHENETFMEPPQSLLRRTVQGLRGAVSALLPGGGSAPEVETDPAAVAMHQQRVAAENLRESIAVRREGRSSVFSIRFVSTDPALAAQVVNAYGRAFVADQLIGNVEAASRVLDWLQNRILVIQRNSTEAALQAELFRARNGLLTVAGESLTVQTISQLNSELSTATVQLARMRALSSVYDELRQLDPVRFVASGAAGVRVPDAEFSAGQERLLGLLQRLEEVQLRHGPDHVEVAQLRDRIATEGRALQLEIERLHETTLNAVRALEAETTMLRASIDEISAENLELATARVELLALERRAQIFDALNETYLLRLQDLEQTQTFPVTNLRVLSLADVPDSAIAPRRTMVLAFMLVLGLGAGTGLAILRERRKQFIRTRDELLDASGRPFLGYLPRMNPAEMEAMATPVPVKRRLRGSDEPRFGFKYPFFVLDHPRSLFAETLRNIRVACETSREGRSGYVLGVVSVRPAEGKSTVSANLAALMAAPGQSVLLIDADFRTSGLSRKLHQSMGAGLREVLVGRDPWQDALRSEATTGLHFLASTFPNDDPVAGDLASAQEFRNVISEARDRYEITVIDLPPLGPVADARALLPVIDGLVMVLEWGKMSTEMLQGILSSDPVLYEKLLGLVLNKTDMEALGKYTQVDSAEGYYDAYVDPKP